MEKRLVTWSIVGLCVLTTIAVTLGTSDGKGINAFSSVATPTPENPFTDLSKKAAVVDYDTPLPASHVEREDRMKKNKRYEVSVTVTKNPHPETVATTGFDVEPMPIAVPFSDSDLVVVGEIQDSRAFLSDNKNGVYTEYSIVVRSILKEGKKLQIGEILVADRAGGIVQYSNGQRVLYLIDWQGIPEIGERYVFFLTDKKDSSPNYKLLTAYQLKNGKVFALDSGPRFHEFNDSLESDFINVVLNSK